MSRCFPYPPPGYTLSGARNEAALIESIKFQKEKERKLERKEKKERRKEKKAKRKERKERKKEKNEKANLNPGESDVQKLLISAENSSIQKHDISPKSFSNRKIEALQKKREAENNQSEQSSLTEDQALLSSLFIPSSSSESTENCKKRKRQSPPEDDTHSQGKVILIRLPSRKQNELDALVQGQQPCSTSGRSDSPSETGDANHAKDLAYNFPNGTRSSCREPNAQNNGENICSTSEEIEAEKTRTSIAKPESVLSSMQKMGLEYQNLLGDFFAPRVQESWLCSDDLGWLLKGNSQLDQEVRAEKKPRYGNDVLSSCSRSLGLWPRAEYLREFDVYVLPFTVPY